ncbi:MAG: Arabinose 5-phosphate isomerase KdsD [Pseudomonadota bacterium]|jgi:arabinose-5-phosphate isomerase
MNTPTAPTAQDPIHDEALLQWAKEALHIEAQAVARLSDQLQPSFAQAVRLMRACTGRVVVMGMGKSGHVGRKVAATLSSTGTPSLFVHPAEASHGDLGMVTAQDVVLAISNSGESSELGIILPTLKRIGVPIVAMTGQAQSSLARHADCVLNAQVEQEACPLNLAPTASTTAQMALGDALAVALLQWRGFKADDFARSHPGGALGRKLLTRVEDLMRTDASVPRVHPQASMGELLHEMSAKGLGASAVVDEAQQLLGIFTDGDLRRLIDRGEDIRTLKAADVMHANPKRIHPHALAAEAAALMEANRITSVLVVNDAGQLVGALNSHDLMKAKVI